MDEGTNYVEIEDELNKALRNVGKTKEGNSIDEKISSVTVNDLLKSLKTDEFEKIYISTAYQANQQSTNKSELDSKIDEIKTLAEYELSKRDGNEVISEDEQKRLKSASNFYLIPHNVKQKVNIGDNEIFQDVNLYTINDVEGYSLYSIIGEDQISITKNFSDRIETYLRENYQNEIDSGVLKVNEVIEYFTPKNIEDLYNILGKEEIVSIRFISERIDEYVEAKGITKKEYDYEIEEEYRDSDESVNRDNLNEITQSGKKEIIPDEETKKVLEKPKENNDKVKEDEEKDKEDDEETKEKVEPYIEKIARANHVSPSVVNTRVIENFEKVQEDTGIPLKGLYARGDVVAVRIPYKLGYRTFLAQKSTGLTIDGRGRMDRRNGKLYDFDEIEDYFRFKLRSGEDGGKDGKPLRYDENRDYTTYIDENGELKEKKFINNGSEKDMLHGERDRYLEEVSKADEKLKDAIDKYQKEATVENYKKVQDIIKEKVEIDNKYNALDKQREVTKETEKNTNEFIKNINKDIEDDQGRVPGPSGRDWRYY